MLPMAAQGAAQAIEDGAALAAILAPQRDDIPSALARYEAVRKPRATRLQELSAINRKRFHLPDGPAQQERDRLLVASGDRSFAALQWLYEHDPAKIPPISD
jgi:salicylate hydroxylase